MSYNTFSEFYDTLTGNINYRKYANYVLELFARHDRTPKLMLDLACGTGNFSTLFARSGIEVIGVDASFDMLTVAKQKAQAMGLNILYICQTMQKLDLYGSVDGAACLLDSLNHLKTQDELARAFERVAYYLEPGRLFIFDMNTLHKLKHVYADNTYVYDEENVFCVWQNDFHPKTKSVAFNIDFFKKEPDETYSRTSEYFYEYAYSQAEVSAALSAAGLKLEAVYNDLTFSQPGLTSERVFYVARKMA